MGKAFLALTAQYLKENYSAYHEVEIIFPTRRACSQFKKYFATQFSTPIWMPNVLAIEDFITKYSENKIAEEWLLMMELYKIYSQLNPVTDFAEFYPWGKVILNDFDETDNYLIDADKLFATLRDLADIDKQFEWDDEQKQFIHDFWESLLGHNYDENTEGIRTHFINNWQYLLDLYKTFKASIVSKGYVYKGLAMRQLVERVVEENLFANRKIIFAGFYALSQSEEKLFSILQERNIATLLWDMDEYYIKDNAQEAGYYLRRQPYIKTTSLFRGTYFSDTHKTITATGTTLAYGQVQFASQCVEKILPLINDKETLTAIVLPDEKLLFPLLRSLPSQLSSVNITMGYPLKNSFVDSMLDAFAQLLLHVQHHKGGVMVSKFYFVQFVNQPASVLLLNIEDINNYLANVSHGYFRLKNIESSFHSELFSLFEKEYKTADEIIEGIISMVKLIIDNGENKLSAMELEMFAFAQSKIIESKKSLQQYSQMLQPADVVFLVKQMIQNLRIPFEGEASTDLQIMGFLETRNLDFDNLIILSMNEGFMPPAPALKSYIPFSLRKAFKLPVHEHNDSINAYHFYRLLQRASHIDLIYDTEISKIGSGEKSRFLLQLELEMSKRLPNIKFENRTSIILPSVEKTPLLDVQKTPKIITQLRKKFIDEKKSFSATAFTTYLDCPLRFYYRYVLGIREPQTAEDEMAPNIFGNVVHKSLEKLYHSNTRYDAVALQKLKSQIEPVVSQIIITEYKSNQLQGSDIVTKEIICSLVEKVIDNDIKRAPVFIDGLEKPINFEIKFNKQETVNITGSIDRLETTTEFDTIIDFKTGAAELHDDIEKLFSNTKYKAAFQLMIYALASCKSNCKVAVYPLKQVGQGFQYLFEEQVVTKEQLELFEQLLSKLIADIFDIAIPFTSTKDLKKCDVCPFNTMCWRG